MCGLIAYFNINKNKEKVHQELIEQYQDQKSRGMEGYGLITINESKKIKIFRATEPVKMLMDAYRNKERIMLLHHRNPTSSSNKINQTHPIEVDNPSLKYKYLAIHNGVITNAKTLKEQHEKEKFEYTTDHIEKSSSTTGITKKRKFNDSEAVAIELSKFIEKKSEHITIEGSLACIIIQINKKTNTARKIYFARNTNPINLAKSREIIRLSSTGPGNETKEGKLYQFNLKDYKITKEKLKIKEKETEREIISSQDIMSETTNPRIGYTTPDPKDEPDTKEPNTLEEKINDQFEEMKSNIEEILDNTRDALITEKDTQAEEPTNVIKEIQNIIRNGIKNIQEEQMVDAQAMQDPFTPHYAEM